MEGDLRACVFLECGEKHALLLNPVIVYNLQPHGEPCSLVKEAARVLEEAGWSLLCTEENGEEEEEQEELYVPGHVTGQP